MTQGSLNKRKQIIKSAQSTIMKNNIIFGVFTNQYTSYQLWYLSGSINQYKCSANSYLKRIIFAFITYSSNIITSYVASLVRSYLN